MSASNRVTFYTYLRTFSIVLPLVTIPVYLWMNKQLDRVEAIVKRDRQRAVDKETEAEQWRTVAIWSLENQTPENFAAKRELADYIEKIAQYEMVEPDRERLLKKCRELRDVPP